MLRLRPLPLTGDLRSVAFGHKSRNTDIDSQITRIPYIRVHVYSDECRIAFVYTNRFYFNQCHSHTHNGFNFSVACVLKTKTKISHTFAHADGREGIYLIKKLELFGENSHLSHVCFCMEAKLMDNNCVHYSLKLLFQHICYSSINTYTCMLWMALYVFVEIWFYANNLKIFLFLCLISSNFLLFLF